MDQLVKAAVEIHLNTNSFNRDGGFILSQAWSPIMNVYVFHVLALKNVLYLHNKPTNAHLSVCPITHY